MTPQDTAAVDALLAVAPAWSGMPTAADATGLADRTILHCGPRAEPSHGLVKPRVCAARPKISLIPHLDRRDDGCHIVTMRGTIQTVIPDPRESGGRGRSGRASRS